MAFQEYPKVLYHKHTPEGRLFQSAEETKDLGRGWVDNPAKLPKPSRFLAMLDKAVKPWWKKWKWLVIGIGSIAGAIVAIIKMLSVLHH